MHLLVRNSSVPRTDFPDKSISGRFKTLLGKEARPLRHQAEAFEHVLDGRAVRLEAGTASGKTLAVALPLFEKLSRGEIRKIVFLYPTLALMEDQRRVMDRLEDVYGFDKSSIGTIRGGMSRSAVVNALGKSVIVATPDAVYWFMRKNVKYSHLLIYGLLLADEIVVDEAHLFAGLSAQNLTAFLDRLRSLRERYLGAASRVHLLTATWPKDGTLDGLSPDAEPISGRSLVGDVELAVERADTPQERSDTVVREALDLLDADCRKVLLVNNSARRAHITFAKMTSARADARKLVEVPDEFKLNFGMLSVREALQAAGEIGALKSAEEKLREELPLPARKVRDGVEVWVRGEVIARGYGNFLESVIKELKSRFWRAIRTKETLSPAELELELGAEQFRRLKELGADSYADYASFRSSLESQASSAQTSVEESLYGIETETGICLTLRGMSELERNLEGAPLLDEFLREFRRSLILSGDSSPEMAGIPIDAYSGAQISVSRFMSWFDEESQAELKPKVLKKVEHRAVRRISGREDGAIAILYSGSMPRYAREGLIALFENLPVPVVLVSTSAVEVGVDFDADALVTEECSGSAFLQRFGRVGRRSGTKAQVKLILAAESYKALQHKLDGLNATSREEFSEIIGEVLQERLSLHESRYIEALQRAVTYQIGEVGQEVTDENSGADELLAQFQDSGVEFAYGLRGSMPGVQLREGIGKSPFYALRFADSERIFPSDSPFELARLDRAFEEIIYTSWEDQRDVFVNLERTWPFIRSMAYLDDVGALRITSVPGAWAGLEGLKETLVQLGTLKQKLDVTPTVSDALGQRMVGLPPGALAHPEALLLYGDIVLGLRASDPEVPDRIENVPYRIQDQWLLLIPGTDQESAQQALVERGVSNLEELFYDYDGLKHNNGLDSNALGLVVLEEQAGACLAAWEKIIGG